MKISTLSKIIPSIIMSGLLGVCVNAYADDHHHGHGDHHHGGGNVGTFLGGVGLGILLNSDSGDHHYREGYYYDPDTGRYYPVDRDDDAYAYRHHHRYYDEDDD